MDTKFSHNLWFRSLLFLGILFVLIQVFSYIPIQRSHEKNGNYWPCFYKELPENSVDIVYMGNSHSNTTFIPEVIDDILDLNSIHVNTSGESIYQTFYEYQEVLHRQNARMVIIETFPIYTGRNQEEIKSWNFSFFFSMPFSFRKMLFTHQFLKDYNLMNFYLPYTIFHANWKHPDEVISRVIETLMERKEYLLAKHQLELPFQGYVNYYQSLSPGEYNSADTVGEAECEVLDLEDRLEVVDDIFAINARSEEDLVFIETPQFINDQAACRQQVIGRIENQGGTYRSLFSEQDRSCLWFGDREHMTQFGAIIASVKTAELLADMLDIDMDTEALDFYRSYFFQDYTFTRDGDQVNVRLIPYDEAALSDLYFTWTLDYDGESVFKNEGVGLNEQTFLLSEAEGSYDLKLIIYNMSGNYFLRGGIDIVRE